MHSRKEAKGTEIRDDDQPSWLFTELRVSQDVKLQVLLIKPCSPGKMRMVSHSREPNHRKGDI